METISPLVKTSIAIEIQAYEFLNMSRKRCISTEEYEKCLQHCLWKFLSQLKIPCRLGGTFDSINKNSSYCKTTPQTKMYMNEWSRKHRNMTIKQDCDCVEPCKKDVLIRSPVYDQTGKPEISIFIESNIVRTLVEVLAYDLVSLLCDIGGNIGLFLGISCLTCFDILTFCEQKLTRFYRKRIHIGNSLEKRIVQIVETEMTRIHLAESKNVSSIWNYGKVKKCLWLLTIVVATLMFAYQSYRIISNYFDYPTYLKVSIVNDNIIRMPAIVVCSLPRIILEEKERIAKVNNLSSHHVDILDFLQYSTKYQNNISQLWNDTSNRHEFLLGEELKYGGIFNLGTTIKPFNTAFGMCTKVSMEPKKFTTYGNMLAVFMNHLNSTSDCHMKHFFIPFQAVLNFKRHVYHRCNTQSKTKFTVQTFIKKNTPRNPCLSSQLVNECEQKCYENELMKKNIRCGLPFLHTLLLPYCNKTSDAKETMKSYLEAFMNTDAHQMCNCYERCEEEMYIPFTIHDPTTPFTMAVFSIPNNLREVIEQQLAFPLIKLLCDIGSNLGIMLGLSILSLFQLVQNIVQVYVVKSTLP